jgi:YHS domain-containing protein
MKRNILIVFIFFAHFVLGQTDEARKKNFNVKKNIAIEGYDPVSYFDDKPMEGNSKWTVMYEGVIYQFSNAANQARFNGSPEKYEPAFGGWCAYAMGESGEKVKIDPQTFKIVDGQLCLFYNFWGNNTLKDWNKNQESLKAKARQNWKKILR